MSKKLRLYRPANGTEGMDFMDAFCDNCVHDQAFRERREGYGCEIIVLTMCHDTDDAEYPREWRYDDDGKPTCTKFKQKPENDGDGDRPPAPPNDPHQIVLLADPTEDAALIVNAPLEVDQVLAGVSE